MVTNGNLVRYRRQVCLEYAATVMNQVGVAFGSRLCACPQIGESGSCWDDAADCSRQKCKQKAVGGGCGTSNGLKWG